MNYAACKRCGVVVPRDEMRSVNVHFFTESESRDIVRVRLCRECNMSMRQSIRAIEWHNELLPGPDGGSGRLHQPRQWARPAQLDDSEAAMRQRGKNLDVTY